MREDDQASLARRVVPLVIAVVLGIVIVIGVATAPPAPVDRAEALASSLRCPVCQSVSVAESRSETALAMRERIDEMVAQGYSDEEVVAFFVERYGQWVVLDPSRSGSGLLLLLLPLMGVVVGAVVIARLHRRDESPVTTAGWHARIADEVDRVRREGEAEQPW